MKPESMAQPPEMERWSEASGSYDALVTLITNPFSFKAFKHHERLWSPESAEPVRFLEIAAGPGYFCKALSEKLRAAGRKHSILCTDFSPAMVDLARERVDDPDVSFAVMDGQDLQGVEDASVDGINCFSALLFMPDPRKCVAKMRRVLKLGGVATVGTWQQGTSVNLADTFGRFLGALGPAEKSVCHELMRFGQDPAELKQVFLEAGFADVSIVEEGDVVKSDDVALLYQLISTNPIMKQALVTGRAGAQQPSLELFQEFLAHSPLAQEFRGDGCACSMHLVCNMTVAGT